MISTDARNALALRINQRFFYGWLMTGVAALTMFATGPGQSHTFSVFLLPISEDLGISMTSVSSAYAFATLVAAFGLPYVGRLVDRHGVRRVLLTVAVLFGCAGIAFGQVVGFIWLTLGFGALRFLGQGSLMLNANNLVAQWFRRRRGFALSLTTLGFSVSMAVHPPLAQWLTAEVGWREAWLWLGVMTWVLLIPPALLLIQNKPEDLDLRPDGRKAPPPAEGEAPDAPSASPAVGLSLPEAMRTPAFWILLLSLSSLSMLVTGMFFHQVSIFEAQGLSAGVASGVFSISAITMVVSMPLLGHLLDRLPTRPMFMSALVMMSVALAAMSFVTDFASAVVYAALFGLANAGLQSHYTFLWARYFGRRHLGTIQGTAQSGMVIGASIGPIPLGVAYDLLASYTGALLVFALLPIAACIAVALMPAPQIEEETD